MKSFRALVASLAVGGFLAANVMAEEPAGKGDNKPASEAPAGKKREKGKGKKKGDQRFSANFGALDKNGDGFLTKDELPGRLAERINRLDRDGDEKVSKEEFTAFIEGMEARRKAKGAPGKAEGEPKPSEAAKSEAKAESKPAGDAKPGSASEKFAKAKKFAKSLNPAEFVGRLDKNSDGKLSKDELPEQMQARFDRLDANGDGAVTKEELQKAFEQMRERMKAKKEGGGGSGGDSPKQRFNRLDLDADGRLSKSEAKGPFADQFDKLDANKDGKLDLREIEDGLKSDKL